MDSTQYISAEKVFTGERWHENVTLVIEEDIVKEIIATDSLLVKPTKIYPIICPALIDLQIYGAGGKLLSMHPTASSLALLYDYCKAGGANWFQPTVATNSYAVLYACIDAVREYKKNGGKGCIGLHVEGPWINPLKRGAHLEEFIHTPTVAEATQLLEYGRDVITMITLAPELCSKEIVDLIKAYDIIVSAGHSNATYEAATISFDQGIPVATHLYNAMSALQHRAPGMVGAIFNHPTVCCSIVPDGYHVDFAAVKIAKKQLGERLFAITDAVTETTTGPYPHQLKGDKYEANGILSGSALTMLQCVKNFVEQVEIELGEAIRMCSLYPARIMRKEGITGLLEPGQVAHYLVLNNQVDIIG